MGSGKIGNAGVFNGSTSLIAPNAVSGGAFSLSLWFQPTNINGDRGGIVNSRNSENWGFFREFAQFDGRIDNAGVGAGGSQGINSPDVIDVGDLGSTWYHLALTWEGNGSTSLGTVYLNGTSYGSTATGTKTFDTPLEWIIGDDPCCGGREVVGLIDDVAFFDTALSASDIAKITDGGNAAVPLDAPTALAVPEPSTALLALLGGCAFFLRRRK